MRFLGATRLLLLPLFLVVLLAKPAQASPQSELQTARTSFLDGDYKTSIGQLTALLYPTSRLAKASLIAEAHLLLGVSFFETGQRDGAAREFEEALFLDDSLSLSTSLFTTEAVNFFDESKAEITRRAKEVSDQERRARQEQAFNKAAESLVVLERYRYWVNYVPFGAGQFQNGQKGKGLAFFVGEAVLGGTTAALWGYQVVKYGIRDGKIPRDEVSTVNTLQVLQIGSGALFIALTAWGIVDSLNNYQYQIERKADPAILKEFRDALENDTDLTPTIVPSAGKDGGGVSLHWEF